MDAGEPCRYFNFSETPPKNASEEIFKKLVAMICRAGEEPYTKSAALLVLMSKLENATHPKTRECSEAFCFAQCGELSLCIMIDTQVAVLENEFASRKLLALRVF